jgi:hypothetical protein
MDCPLLNEYFTLAVNLGVLVGIVFLIVEIKKIPSSINQTPENR